YDPDRLTLYDLADHRGERVAPLQGTDECRSPLLGHGHEQSAALFAIVVNLQVSDAVLGSLEEVALVHKIHILAMAYIFVAALLAIVSRRGYESGRNKLARRRDLVGFFAFGLSFVAFNVALIAAAAIAG
ncbi:MAG: hypothetical protein M3397_08240, partial [Actinomycetota bacterium]|nr:hypothetical protein [Actinomycetota bacterium]